MSLLLGYFAFKKIEKAAEELRQKKGAASLTKEQAIVKAVEQNPGLKAQYDAP
jgi:hypothetical protein